MNLWLHLPLAFASGFALGTLIAFWQFKSRLKVYRRYIENRLAQANLDLSEPRNSVPAGRFEYYQ